MSNTFIKFLEKEYSIPEDLVTYVELLTFTDDIKLQLMNAFIRKLNSDDVGCIDDTDLKDDMDQQVSKFVKKLCDHDIYDRTIKDYYQDNKGFEFFSKANKNALEKMKELLMDKIDMLQAGYEDALYKKESSITGMGFSIFSGSFVNHAIYAAMEASTIREQEKKATEEYRRDMNELHAKMDAQFGKQKSRYINERYIPEMNIALTAFSYGLLDKYVRDLTAYGKFDPNTMNFIDMGRSNELLDNLSLSNNKKAIIEKAFEVCPYNAAVYVNALKCGLLDKDSFKTAEYFGQGNTIISYLKSNIGEAVYPDRYSLNINYIELLAKYTEENAEELKLQFTSKYVEDVIKQYNLIKSKLSDKEEWRKIVIGWSDDIVINGEAFSKGEAYKQVDSIISGSVWHELVNKCGHSNLLSKLKDGLPEASEINTKLEFDNYLKEKIFEKIEEARKGQIELIKAKKEAEKKLQLEEEQKQKIKLEQKAKRRNIITKVIIMLAASLVVFGTILLIVTKINDSGKSKKSLENIAHLTSFLEDEYNETGKMSFSDGDYEFVTNSVQIFDMEGHVELNSYRIDEELVIVGSADWVSNDKIESLDETIDNLKELYGTEYVVQEYNGYSDSTYIWKDVENYSYVICWKDSDNKVNIKWTVLEGYQILGIYGFDAIIDWSMNMTEVEALNIGVSDALEDRHYISYDDFLLADKINGELFIGFDDEEQNITTIQFEVMDNSSIEEIGEIISEDLGNPIHKENFNNQRIKYPTWMWSYGNNQYIILREGTSNDSIYIDWERAEIAKVEKAKEIISNIETDEEFYESYKLLYDRSRYEEASIELVLEEQNIEEYEINVPQNILSSYFYQTSVDFIEYIELFGHKTKVKYHCKNPYDDDYPDFIGKIEYINYEFLDEISEDEAKRISDKILLNTGRDTFDDGNTYLPISIIYNVDSPQNISCSIYDDYYLINPSYIYDDSTEHISSFKDCDVSLLNLAADETEYTVDLYSDAAEDCWKIAKEAVLDNLQDPGSAQFPNMFDGVSLIRSGNTYQLTSFVKAYNLLGEVMRAEFKVVIERDIKSYKVIDIVFEE